jgi:DMSO/TMAO reductase YedYZ heme-binding membrane subunit
LVSFSFYLTKRIGHGTWHLIHMLSYVMFVGVTIHSVFLGTDSRTVVMQIIYLLAGSSILFLSLFRILSAAAGSNSPERVQTRRQRRSGSPG